MSVNILKNRREQIESVLSTWDGLPDEAKASPVACAVKAAADKALDEQVELERDLASQLNDISRRLNTRPSWIPDG